MKKTVDAALEYLDQGLSIIPIKLDSKRPAIKWQEFQERLPTEDEVVSWFDTWPDAGIAIITGAISGVVVVDCDNPDALHAAFDAGMRSPVRVKTKRGTHLYFAHPRDGIRRGPRAGVNSRGADWPRIDGLDFRGDGSYALLPPTNNYSWDFAVGTDWDDLPVWEDWHPGEISPSISRGGVFEFENLDLSAVRPLDEFASEWDRTARFVRERFPSTLKIPSGMGNGRNERVMRYVSECILEGYWGDELRLRGRAFMHEFFEHDLAEPEYEATCRSIEQAERRNHPERFDDEGQYIPSKVAPGEPAAVKAKTRRLITMADADEMLAKSEATQYLIEPWLKRGTIVQVYGYSGHGKSLFLQHGLAALASGRKYYGPFEIHKPGRVLYLDFENGQTTLATRLLDLKAVHGDTKDRLQIWTPFIEGTDLDLKKRENLIELQGIIELAEPDVIVIDTVRSAYPGLQENSAEDWARINQLALKLRNAGFGVVLVHHSNKPQDGAALGREAGSTNQLTVLETQIRVTQVYEDKETADQNAALYDGGYAQPVFPMLRKKLPPGWDVYMVMEIRYGKVREWTEAHDRVQWVGLAHSLTTDERAVVSSRSTKQRAKDMALDGMPPEEISSLLNRPLRTIRSWLEL